MVTFPTLGQQGPNFWNTQLQEYIDERARTTATDATVASRLVIGSLSAAAVAGLVGTDGVVKAAVDARVTAGFAGTDLGTANLNTITTPGVYWQLNGANSTPANNYPVAERCTVEVLPTGTAVGRFVTQRVTVVAGANRHRDTWVRRGQNTTGTTWVWEDWLRSSTIRMTAGGGGRNIYLWDTNSAAEARILPIGMFITTQDLNDYVTPGIYNQNNQASATLARNYPQASISGTLEVLDVNGTGDVTQRFTPHRSSLVGRRGHWVRSLISGSGWTTWAFFGSTRSVPSLPAPNVEIMTWDERLGVERQTQIVNVPLGNVDLNTVTSVGVYHQGIPTNVTLANNYPAEAVGLQGTVEVMRGNDAAQGHLQRFTPHVGAPRSGKVFYQRSYISAGWQPWQQFSMMKVAGVAGLVGAATVTTYDLGNGVDVQLQPTNIVLGTQDLNTITTTGTYTQGTPANATLATNYPFANALVVLEVTRLGVGFALQRITPTGGITGAARGIWQRRQNGGTWDPWRFIPTQRVDQTAGRAIYTWDDVNGREQLVYGDTGWRDISSLLVNGWTAAQISLRRTAYSIEFRANGLNPSASTSSVFANLPTGWVGWNGLQDPRIPVRVGTTVREVVFGSNVVAEGRLTTDPAFNVNHTWTTTNPWPASLPGTAVGTIPNL